MIALSIASPGTPHVLGIYSFRFDAHLVAGLRVNTKPLVDGWISWDDTRAEGLFTDEIARRMALLEAARDAGARWVWVLDPDERLEYRTRWSYGRLLKADVDVVTFPLREMYAPNAFRVDGVWGLKRQPRLLNLESGIRRPDVAPGTLHVPWTQYLVGSRALHTSYNVYHLKMIEARRRTARAALYAALDPESRMQSIGYGYLDDETGMRLRRVGWGRGYVPRHLDDGELWMPDLPRSEDGAT